ncbi:hypothetical protein PVT67_09430 [Gallaecimonas kandeliae]|uniref:hypothetical protein n=1 Tax=Gallaecimonas kandeliae TaxID=3029055 RepID=UPI002647653A|nr:hypothetical protein [Gallaecimonas kandeliae]WKE63921.1 hypothetical protein PVT67_09430 [Gallaecimonas kandeliae]
MRSLLFICYGLLLGVYPLVALVTPYLAFNPYFAVLLPLLWLGLFGHGRRIPLLTPGSWQLMAVALLMLLLFMGLGAWQDHILTPNGAWHDFSDSSSLSTYLLQLTLLVPWVALMLRYGDWQHPAWLKSPKGQCAYWLAGQFDSQGQLHLKTLGYDLKAEVHKDGIAVVLQRGRQQFHQLLPDIFQLVDFVSANSPLLDEVMDWQLPHGRDKVRALP